MTLHKTTYLSLAFLVCCSIGLLFTTRDACAGASATPSVLGACDANYMDQLNQKAYLEAQREIELNGRYIWKPDSVLAMTCFQQAMNHATVHIPEIFSEAGDNGGGNSPRREELINAAKATPGITPSAEYPDHFADNMSKTIGPMLKKYLGANYSHPFSSLSDAPKGVSILGQQNKLKGFDAFFDRNTSSPYPANVDYGFVWGFEDPQKPVEFKDFLRKDYKTPITDDCSWMRQMWELSKCYSFDLKDDFVDVAFRDISNGGMQFAKQDLRGKSCGDSRPAVEHGGESVITGTQRKLADATTIDARVKMTNSVLEAERITSNAKLFDDIVSNFNTILDRTSAGGCLGGAIATGVTVTPTSANATPFQESFCPNPGCSYNKTSCVPN